MLRNRKTLNFLVIAILTFSIGGIGILGYSRVSADTILPGYATAHFHLQITVPEMKTVPVKAVFTPTQGSKFYFKDRDFSFATPGINSVDWFVRKIPEGEYSVAISSPSGAFEPSTMTVTLLANKVNDLGGPSLNLGTPVVTVAPTTQPTELPLNSVAPSPTETAADTSTGDEDLITNDGSDNNSSGDSGIVMPPSPPLNL